ncbi:MAG TPA: ABC transporter permease [Longimicrobiaceae bacterium]|nr:ABC transporter permease [Longimicrobiaceae bacterium]
MDSFLQDLRYALRSLRRSPSFAAAAMLCLALGMGVNTATFSIVNTLLFRPPPFEDADRVVLLYAQPPKQGWEEDAFSSAELADVRAGSRALADVAGAGSRGFNLAGDDEPVRVAGSPVTPNLFPLLGVRPALGRGFLPGEDRPGSERVVVLGHRVWQTHFGGRRDVVGRTTMLNGVPTTVVGVMPPGFRFPETADLWVPARTDSTAAYDARWLVAVGRLRPGADVEQANADLARVARRMAAEHPGTHAGWSLGARPFGASYVRGDRGFLLYLMLGGVGFVLLIACANVANLLLARGSTRRREIAVRAALGAGRGRIVRQLLTESVLLAVGGGALGVLVGSWWLDWTMSRLTVDVPYWMTFQMDWRVLLYTLALAVATGLLFGILPALRASRAELTGALKDGAPGDSGGLYRNRLRGALVAGEIALSLVLLAGAALSIRSFLAALDSDPAVDGRSILTARTSLAGERYDAVASRAAFFRELEGRLRALPGVQGAALTTALPAGDVGVGTTVRAEGRPGEDGEAAGRWIAVTPGYWGAIGRPLLAGRSFTAAEAADSAAAVALVSAELAERLWPGQDPLGRRIRVEVEGADRSLAVVGIAPTLPYARPGTGSPRDRLQVHVPYGVAGWRLMTLAVRSAGDPAALSPALRREVRAMDPTLPVFTVHVLGDYRASTLWMQRAAGQVFASLALLALGLAALGVYGVMAYTVAQRTREIGIRVALGARAPDVVRMVVAEAAVLAAAGIAVGLPGAYAVARLMRGTLYGVGPGDPVAFLAVPLLLGGVAMLASWLPARRASRVDPIVALRAD